MKRFATLLITSLAFISIASADGNSQKGEQKAAPCAGCHGEGGKTPSPAAPDAPVLAGQHADYLAQQLKAFSASCSEAKAECRESAIMAPMAAMLAGTGIDDVAAYYASQVNTPIAITEEEKAAGESLYRGGNPATNVAACIGCHGPTGTGNAAAKFPSISGQNPLYVIKSLKDFRSGARTSTHNGMMNGVTGRLTDSEIDVHHCEVLN